jgi:hypothetical protein
MALNLMPSIDRKLRLNEKLIAFENYLIHKHDNEAVISNENSDEPSKSDEDGINQPHSQN